MKTPLLYIALITGLISPRPAFTQTFKGQQQVSLSYGFLSGRQVADNLSEDDNGGGVYAASAIGPAYISYRYFVGKRIGLGLTAGIQYITGGNYNSNGNYHLLVNNYKFTNIAAAAEMVYVYTNKRYVQVYTLLGCGISSYKRTDNPVSNVLYYPDPTSGKYFNMQYTPLAIKAGGKVSGFLEFGAGYKGLLNMGITVSFGKDPDN